MSAIKPDWLSAGLIDPVRALGERAGALTFGDPELARELAGVVDAALELRRKIDAVDAGDHADVAIFLAMLKGGL